MMQVTESELIYTDKRTSTSWKWPLKFLRKYGCDGEVFSFEAGRKCPGGEGLYAFSAKRASQIFDMVARNINQGGLQPPAGDLSPFPSESHPPEQNTLISRRNSSQSPVHHNHTDQPNYANMDISGNPLVQVETGIDPTLPSREPVRPVAYKEVIFERPPDHHPLPKVEKEPRPSYTKIDFAETENYNKERRLGTLPELQFAPQGRTSTSSLSGHPSSRAAERSGKRSRMHTYSGPGGSTGRSPSESSFSSQGSLTESTRDVRPSLSSPAMGGQSHVSLDTPSSGAALYQNIIVSKEGTGASVSLPHAPPPQQQYQNVTVGAGSVGQVFNTPQQMTNGGSHSTHTPRSASQSGTKPHSRNMMANGISPVVVNGNPMAHYADLELGNNARKRTTSTPIGAKAPPNLSYSVMEFTREGKFSPSHSSTTPSSSSAVPQPSLGNNNSSLNKTVNGDACGRHVLSSISSKGEEPHESVVSITTNLSSVKATENSKTVQDETKVEYGVLNFPVMATLEKMKGDHLKGNERGDPGHTSSSKKSNKKRD